MKNRFRWDNVVYWVVIAALVVGGFGVLKLVSNLTTPGQRRQIYEVSELAAAPEPTEAPDLNEKYAIPEPAANKPVEVWELVDENEKIYHVFNYDSDSHYRYYYVKGELTYIYATKISNDEFIYGSNKDLGEVKFEY